jgi:hypothetical protein
MLHVRCVFTMWVQAVVFERRPCATCCNAVLLILRTAPSFDPFASLPRLFSSVVTFRRRIYVSQRPQRRLATAHGLSVLMVTLRAEWLLHRMHCIISLYSINWQDFITVTEYSLRGTDWIFKYDSAWRVLYEPCHGSGDERFELAKVALAQAFLRAPRFWAVSIIAPMLCTHLHTRRTNGRNPGTFQNAMLLWKWVSMIEKYFHLFCYVSL